MLAHLSKLYANTGSEGAFEEIEEVISINYNQGSYNFAAKKHLGSLAEIKQPTIETYGNITFSAYHVDDETFSKLLDLKGVQSSWKIEDPDGATYVMTGFLTDLSKNHPSPDDFITYDGTIELNSNATVTPGA